MKKIIYTCDVTGETDLSEDQVVPIEIFINSTKVSKEDGGDYRDNYETYDISIQGAKKLIDFVLDDAKQFDEKLLKKMQEFIKLNTEKK